MELLFWLLVYLSQNSIVDTKINHPLNCSGFQKIPVWSSISFQGSNFLAPTFSVFGKARDTCNQGQYLEKLRAHSFYSKGTNLVNVGERRCHSDLLAAPWALPHFWTSRWSLMGQNPTLPTDLGSGLWQAKKQELKVFLLSLRIQRPYPFCQSCPMKTFRHYSTPGSKFQSCCPRIEPCNIICLWDNQCQWLLLFSPFVDDIHAFCACPRAFLRLN